MYLNLIFTEQPVIVGLILQITDIVTAKGGPQTAWNAMLTSYTCYSLYVYTRRPLLLLALRPPSSSSLFSSVMHCGERRYVVGQAYMHSIYIRTVSSLHLLSALLNWFKLKLDYGPLQQSNIQFLPRPAAGKIEYTKSIRRNTVLIIFCLG